jgi:outer membrane protein assembly factor BamB
VNGPSLHRLRRPSHTAAFAAAAFLLAFSIAAARADWLFYRGPTENGVSSEKTWSPQFGAGGPKVLWKAALGTGLSSVTVSDGHAFSMGNKDDMDFVYCFDAATGKEVWRHQFPLKLDPNMFEGGPRSTPTLDGAHVYTVSHEGDLWCLEAATGKKIWYRHYQTDLGGRRPQWGYAGSPLLAGDLLICDVGGSGSSTVAFDRLTGAVAWKSGSDQAGYASPVLATLDGKPTVVILKADTLVGCDPKDGKELWRAPWKTEYDVNAATPLIIDSNKILVTSGYNAGCVLFEVRAGKIRELWHNKNLRSHINTPVAVGGFVYGTDGNVGGGNLVCLDLATGERKWEEKSVKGGSLIAANGKLIVLSEKGELVVCDASPAGFHAISRAPVLTKRCWVQPTLDAGKLFVKNNFGDLECLALTGN